MQQGVAMHCSIDVSMEFRYLRYLCSTMNVPTHCYSMDIDTMLQRINIVNLGQEGHGCALAREQALQRVLQQFLRQAQAWLKRAIRRVPAKAARGEVDEGWSED